MNYNCCGNNEFVLNQYGDPVCTKCGMRFNLNVKIGSTFQLAFGCIADEIYYHFEGTHPAWCRKCSKECPKNGCLVCKFKGLVAERKLKFIFKKLDLTNV